MAGPSDPSPRRTAVLLLAAGVLAVCGAGMLAFTDRAPAFGLSLIAGGLACLMAGAAALARTVAGLRQSAAELRLVLDETIDQLGRDPLTGRLNRTAFNRKLAALAETHSADTMVMLVFFDLDRFKEVNDTLGHDIGDQLLQEVADRTCEAMPELIAFARLGGDEFAAIVPYEDEARTHELGDRIVQAIARPFELAGRLVEVGASVGIAIGDPAVQGGDELLRRADLAMYEVKGTSKGYQVFDDLMSHRQVRENLIRTEMGKAEFDKRFMLHYQPIVDARTGRIVKVEALLRPKAGVLEGLSPALMVEIAEDSGQIVNFTDWTIDEALATASEIELPVAVNVSPIYFRRKDFADRVIDKLIGARLTPDRLIVEITERVLIANIETTRECIDYLRAVGIRVWLDDFGTGYSSLSYLQNFELDGLKLDRSFIHELGRSEKAARIIRSIIDFGHSLDMKTVVEGVESEWQARMLQLQGCDYLQGYFLSLPVRKEELIALLRQTADAGIHQSAIRIDPGPCRLTA